MAARGDCIIHIDSGMRTYTLQADTQAEQDEWVSDLTAHGVLADENSTFGMAELIMSEEGRMRSERWISNVDNVLGHHRADRDRGRDRDGNNDKDRDQGKDRDKGRNARGNSVCPVSAALYWAHTDAHTGVLAKQKTQAMKTSGRFKSTADRMASRLARQKKGSSSRNLQKIASGQGHLSLGQLTIDRDGNVSRGPSRGGSPRRGGPGQGLGPSPRSRAPLPLQRVPSGYSHWDLQKSAAPVPVPVPVPVPPSFDTYASGGGSVTVHPDATANVAVGTNTVSSSNINENTQNNSHEQGQGEECARRQQQRQLMIDTKEGSTLEVEHVVSQDDATVRSIQVSGPSPREYLSSSTSRVRAAASATARGRPCGTLQLLSSLDAQDNTFYYGPVNTTFGETTTLTPRALAFFSSQTYEAGDSYFSDSDEDEEDSLGGGDQSAGIGGYGECDSNTDAGTEYTEATEDTAGMYEFEGYSENSPNGNSSSAKERGLARPAGGTGEGGGGTPSGLTTGGGDTGKSGDGLDDWDTMDDVLYPAGKSPLFSGLSSGGSIAESRARLTRKGHACRVLNGSSCRYMHPVIQQLRISQTLHKALRWANDTHRYREKMRHDLNVASREQWIEAMWIFNHYLAPDLMAISSSGLDIYEASADATATAVTTGAVEDTAVAQAALGTAAATTTAAAATTGATATTTTAGTEDSMHPLQVTWIVSPGAIIRCRDKILRNIEICAGYASYNSPAIMERGRSLTSSTEDGSDHGGLAQIQGQGDSNASGSGFGTGNADSTTRSSAIMMNPATTTAIAGMKAGSPSGSTASPSPSPQQTGSIWGWFTGNKEVTKHRQAPDLSEGNEEYITMDFDARGYGHEAHSDHVSSSHGNDNDGDSAGDLASPRSQASHGSSASGFYAEEQGHRKRAFQVFSITNPVERPPANLFDELSVEVEAFYRAQRKT